MTTTRRWCWRLRWWRRRRKAQVVAASKRLSSRAKTNLPSRRRTALEIADALACGVTQQHEFLRSSGATHIRQRDPCCWKCTSSMAQRSTFSLAARAWSFFMRRLFQRVCIARLAGEACGSETPTGAISAGIAAGQAPSGAFLADKPTWFSHPKDCPTSPPRSVCHVQHVADRRSDQASTSMAARCALPPAALQTHLLRSVPPKKRPCVVRPEADRPPGSS